MTEAPVVTAFAPPRFAVDDPEGYTYLEEHGYVVFKDVLTPAQARVADPLFLFAAPPPGQSEVEQGRSLAWDFLEGLSYARISRTDPETWNDSWPDPLRKGILVGDGVGQSEFMWFNRSLDTVHTIFSTVWGTPDLAVSFDGFNIFRPTEYNKAWATDPGRWYHVDQDGVTKPGRVCLQGLINYYDSGETDGGFIVVPDSHKIFADIFRNRPSLGNQGDFVSLDNFGPYGVWHKEIKQAGLKPVKLCLGPGDMVLWDSRTIHCNSAPTALRPLPQDGSVLPPRRLVAYVCMTPASRLTEEAKQMRRECYLGGYSTTHWPELVQISGVLREADRDKWRSPKLSPKALKLIPLSEDAC